MANWSAWFFAKLGKVAAHQDIGFGFVFARGDARLGWGQRPLPSFVCIVARYSCSCCRYCESASSSGELAGLAFALLFRSSSSTLFFLFWSFFFFFASAFRHLASFLSPPFPSLFLLFPFD